MVARLNAVPLSIWEANRLHITLGDNSGFSISTTEICGFFKPNFEESTSVNSLIPLPLRPITIPGLVTYNEIREPVGVFEISTSEKPASLIFSRK